MKIHHLAKNNSVLNTFLKEIREQDIQKDSMRFRRNIERIGEVLSYELSKDLSFSSEQIQTVLGVKESEIINDNLVICSILRAGLPLHQEFLTILMLLKVLLFQHIVITQKMTMNLKLR